jgi:hypothetical protein
VAYAIVPHRAACTAQEEAQEEAAGLHIPCREWAKGAGGAEIRFAREDELRRLVPDCEAGGVRNCAVWNNCTTMSQAMVRRPSCIPSRRFTFDRLFPSA